MSFSRREKFYTYNTLVCLVEGLEGKYTTIDLRNESYVYGKVTEVDGYMNVILSDAAYVDGRGSEFSFDSFFVHARNIRYVHIPNELSIIETINDQLKKVKHILKPDRQMVSNRVQQMHFETLQKMYSCK